MWMIASSQWIKSQGNTIIYVKKKLCLGLSMCAHHAKTTGYILIENFIFISQTPIIFISSKNYHDILI